MRGIEDPKDGVFSFFSLEDCVRTDQRLRGIRTLWKSLKQGPDPLGEDGVDRAFTAGRRLHSPGFRRGPRDLQHPTESAV